MSQAEAAACRATPEPLPANIASVQPGGGVCYRIELAWGRWRRWYLRKFRPGYVRRMEAKRQGDLEGCPHEVLDPRDLKYCRNRCRVGWSEADDRFRWRERILLARWGLAEVQLIGYPLLALASGLAASSWYLAFPPGILFCLVVWFFRDPVRRAPREPGLVVSPADGTIAEVVRQDYDEYVRGPVVRIGIFLSIFNVHLNRSPVRARVIRLRYAPGKFLNAMRPASARENESMWIGLEEEEPPHRRLIVRQIAGLFARRIVCDLRPGEVVERGQKFGMIKLGSRTELILPEADELHVEARVGQRVKAGSSVVARFDNGIAPGNSQR